MAPDYRVGHCPLTFNPQNCSFLVFAYATILVFANAARRDAGFFNVFLLRSYFLWVVWVGGWGDVNVPWKRYVTYAGVGVGGVG